MRTAAFLKTTTLFALVSLTFAAVPGQADDGYGYYSARPNPGAWSGSAPNVNPWMNNPGFQQARFAAAMKQRQAQLDQRQDAQMQRILNGMESGRLTLREATGLLREHIAIANLERGFMADGRLGPNELASLEQRLNEAERQITFEQRDREKTAQMHRPGEPERHGEMERRGDLGRYGDDRPGEHGRTGESGRR